MWLYRWQIIIITSVILMNFILMQLLLSIFPSKNHICKTLKFNYQWGTLKKVAFKIKQMPSTTSTFYTFKWIFKSNIKIYISFLQFYSSVLNASMFSKGCIRLWISDPVIQLCLLAYFFVSRFFYVLIHTRDSQRADILSFDRTWKPANLWLRHHQT